MRQRALWRVLPYLRPHRAKVVFIAVTAIVSIGCQLAIPLIVKAAIDGPITDGDKSRPAAALRARGRARARSRSRSPTAGASTLAVVATDVETRAARRLLRAPAAARGRLPRPLAVGPVALAGELRHLDDPPVRRVRRDLPAGHRRSRWSRSSCSSCFLYVPLGAADDGDRDPGPGAVPALRARVPPGRAPHPGPDGRHDDRRSRSPRRASASSRPSAGARRCSSATTRNRWSSVTPSSNAFGSTRSFIWVLVLIPNLTLAGVLLAGALAVAADSLTVGGLVAFITYVLILVWPIEELGWILAMAEEAETAAGRVWEVFDTEPVIADRPDARPLVARARRGALRATCAFAYPGADRTRAARRRPRDPARRDARARRRDRCRQDDDRDPARAALRPDTRDACTLDGHDLRDVIAAQPARSRGIRVRGTDPVLRERAREPADRSPGRDRRPTSTPRSTSRRRRSRTTCRGDSTRASANRASRSRAGNVSGSRSARAIIGRPRVLVLDDPLSALDVHTEALVEDALRPILADRTALVVVHRPSTRARGPGGGAGCRGGGSR